MRVAMLFWHLPQAEQTAEQVYAGISACRILSMAIVYLLPRHSKKRQR